MSSTPRYFPGLLLLGGAMFVAAVRHDTRAHIPHSRAAWYHRESHPVHVLFTRNVTTPGSPEWMAQYPAVWAPPIPEAATPQSWLNALHAAEQAGQIPNISVTTQSIPTANPKYDGEDPSGAGPAICSSTANCRGPGDLWDAPDGHVSIGFDDGPAEGSALLYPFLQEKNQSATHFMIGINILNNYGLFDQAFHNLHNDIAVHTWTHPYMTTMNNSQVVAQLGWTMQIIHDSTGGRVPRYWRPPYGDSDNRVRAIAKTVFGLTGILWNKDTEDWSIDSGGTTLPQVINSLNTWYSGPKSPGLIILEHELTNDTSTAFIQTYPAIAANNWTAESTVQLFSGAYQNADDNVGPVLSMDVAGTVPTSTSTVKPILIPTTTTTRTSSTSSSAIATPLNDNHNINTNDVVRIRREGLSIFLLIGTLISIFW